jgi:outer membrane protein assembly factor BamB
VRPLDGPVRVLWRLPGAHERPQDVDGLLVVPARGSRGATDVVALDPLTGAETWRTPVGPPDGAPDAGAGCEAPAAPAGAGPGSRVVACVVADDTDTADVVGIGTVTYPTRTRLVVLDAARGMVLRDDVVPPTTSAAALGPDLLLAHVDEDGYARLARTDPRDGTARWSFRSPRPLERDELGQRSASVTTDGETVVLDAGPVWLLDPDGAPLRAWAEADEPELGSGGVRLLPGRGLVVRARVDDGLWVGQVHDVRTPRSFPIDGYPASVWPDDGSLDDVLLVERGGGTGSRAYDAATGRVLWALPETPYASQIVLDGRVIRLERDSVRAVDGRTGEVVWFRPLERAGQRSIVTDGRVVVVGDPGRRLAGGVTAFGVEDGRERWSAELGTDAYLFATGHHLMGVVPDGLVVLGHPRDDAALQ